MLHIPVKNHLMQCSLTLHLQVQKFEISTGHANKTLTTFKLHATGVVCVTLTSLLKLTKNAKTTNESTTVLKINCKTNAF
jgi:hypothetical protein